MLRKPLISVKSFNDSHSFKNNLLSVHSRTRTSRFESWFHPPIHCVALGKPLNPSGPQFSLLGNVGLFLGWSTVWIKHLLCAGALAALVALVLIFLVWVSLSLIHFQPLVPALPACHCFHGFLTLCLQLSVNYL